MYGLFQSTTGILIRHRLPPDRLRRIRRRLLLALFVLGLGLVGALRVHPYGRLFWQYNDPPECYIVPVTGVRAADLTSTFGAPRSGGRKHKGVDIFAERGTAVVSATDGVVWRVGRNKLGGNVVWILGEGFSLYYYAHMDSWAPGLRKGVHVHAGEPLGAVGNSGNARTTPTHLHFSVTSLSLMGRRRALDPVPVLAQGRTMPAYTLDGAVQKPGSGPHRRGHANDWSGNPCHLPRFPHAAAKRTKVRTTARHSQRPPP